MFSALTLVKVRTNHRRLYSAYTVHAILKMKHAPDPSTLGNIDPDINYFSANNMLKNTPYYNDKTFKRN